MNERIAMVRPVEFCKKGFFGGTDKNTPKDFERGLFHGFFTEGNLEEGVECYALVERDDGTTTMVMSHKLRFLDKCDV